MSGLAQAVAALAMLFLLGTGPALAQQTPAGPDLADLMGAPVFAADGQEVGEVSAFAMSGDGTISEIRVSTASPLGMGLRTVVLPPERYMILRGAVVVDLSTEEFDALPSAGKTR